MQNNLGLCKSALKGEAASSSRIYMILLISNKYKINILIRKIHWQFLLRYGESINKTIGRVNVELLLHCVYLLYFN